MNQRIRKKQAKQQAQTQQNANNLAFEQSTNQLVFLAHRMYQFNPEDVRPVAQAYLKSDHIDLNSESFLANGLFYYLTDFIDYYQHHQ